MSVMEVFRGLHRSTDLQKKCPKCGEMHSRMRDHAKGILASYCRKCHADYCRPRRTKYKDLPPQTILKMKSRAKAQHAFKKGLIIQKPCRLCGEVKTEMHHEDYSKPLDVIWLCKLCHTRLHWLRGDLAGIHPEDRKRLEDEQNTEVGERESGN